MTDATGCDAETNTRKDIGIISLTRVEDLSIWQHDWVKRTATGKDAPSLVQYRNAYCIKV